jgi:hypothetical protein
MIHCCSSTVMLYVDHWHISGIILSVQSAWVRIWHVLNSRWLCWSVVIHACQICFARKKEEHTKSLRMKYWVWWVSGRRTYEEVGEKYVITSVRFVLFSFSCASSRCVFVVTQQKYLRSVQTQLSHSLLVQQTRYLSKTLHILVEIIPTCFSTSMPSSGGLSPNYS